MSMNEYSNEAAHLIQLPIIGQPGYGEAARCRVPDWVNNEAMLKRLGPEFAERADLPPDGPTRRQFMQVMGASAALAAAGGCFQQPQEEIVPYVRPPEHVVPGKPLYYATAMTLGGGSMGLLVETHMGRPTKVEGNPLHPAVPQAMHAQGEAVRDVVRFGATDAFGQAAVLSLYDPDRSQTILRGGQINTWESLYTELRAVLERLAPNGGDGLRVLMPPVLSPTLTDQLQQLQVQFPKVRWHHYEPIHDDNARAGAQMAFGQAVVASYPRMPDVVLSLDADLFGDGAMRLQLARSLRGQVPAVEGPLPRLYVIETSFTITGASADHRLPASPNEVIRFAQALLQRLEGGEDRTEEVHEPFLAAIAADLANARGRGLVIAGRGQPPVVHAIAHRLNATLGNVGETIEYYRPAPASPAIAVDEIRELAQAMRDRQVTALMILGGNPVYDAPADVRFADALAAVPFSLHLSPYVDETSMQCTWHVPEAHLFESWSDACAVDGSVSIVQPLIAPLYDGKTSHELMAALMGVPSASSHDLVRAFWQRALGSSNDSAFERTWKTALHDGIMTRRANSAIKTTLAAELGATINDQTAALLVESQKAEMHLSFRPDPSVWDGRFANNGWLQELPRPLTKLTWDNAVLLSPRTASVNKIRTGDVVEIESGKARVKIPAFVLPGHPDQTLTVHLGYGRRNAGRVGNAVGVDVYPLRTTAATWFANVTNFRNTGRTVEFASTQHHHHMHGRELVRAGTWTEYREAPEHPAFMQAHGHGESHASMYPQFNYDGYKWGMVVNQSACTGCNACVVACQAENNIPVVGKDQVSRGREMHWLRIDSYFVRPGDQGPEAGKSNNSDSKSPAAGPRSLVIHHQPVMCQHCELAPCEPVCPVMATTHSAEGLNEMTYNRCVGTRYCSNNCPYKVRRFNFFDYNAELRDDPTLHLLPNPDVTIRSRGVMEKCTYCVQRINSGRIAADIGNRSILDGEILTACQAACPTQAITFGNLNDAQSVVRKQVDSSLNYSLLGELNTLPRTTYLAVVRNLNSELG
jgi:molybdopterin-containing oxidoreductase family iron-sulfur binding subunit